MRKNTKKEPEKSKWPSEPVKTKLGELDSATPQGELLARMELQIEIYEDGLLRFGDRLVWKHEKVSNGMANLLAMAAVAVSKDSAIHARWKMIDTKYIEELEARAKKAKAALRKTKG